MSQTTFLQLTSGNTAITSGNTSAVQVVTLPIDAYGVIDQVSLLGAGGVATGVLPVTCAVVSAAPVSAAPVQVQLAAPAQLSFGANAPLLDFSNVAPPVSGGVTLLVHGRPLREMQQTS